MTELKREPSLQNKRAVGIANKMGKRYTLLDAMLMGKKLKIDWKKEKFKIGDLLVGMHYELEHGKADPSTNVTDDNALKTAKIAWAHLKERPDYYVQLMKIDPPKKLEKKASEALEDMCMEKAAAARWRKEWGNLSPDSQRRLQADGQIASPLTETVKRNSGFDSIKDKYGIEYRTAADKGNLGGIEYIEGKIGKKMPLNKRLRYKLMQPGDGIINTGPVTFNSVSKGHMVIYDGFQDPEKNNFKGTKAFNKFLPKGTTFKKLYYEDRPLYDEIHSMLKLHEGSEAVNFVNNGFATQYSSHAAPQVMHRESASVATASPEAKAFFEKMRNRNITAYIDKSGKIKIMREANELGKNGKTKYGKNAVINRKNMINHNNMYDMNPKQPPRYTNKTVLDEYADGVKDYMDQNKNSVALMNKIENFAKNNKKKIAGVALGAALLSAGGAYIHHRRKKQAEQELKDKK